MCSVIILADMHHSFVSSFSVIGFLDLFGSSVEFDDIKSFAVCLIPRTYFDWLIVPRALGKAGDIKTHSSVGLSQKL